MCGRGFRKDLSRVFISSKSKTLSHFKMYSAEGFPDRGIYKSKGLRVRAHPISLRNSQKVNMEGVREMAEYSCRGLKFESQNPHQAAHNHL